ncbi:MFS general substrate transporter [Aureobasidium pullulans]|nr:MFS general substrate transporter [Aureobasidium pullulans]
MSPPVEPSVEVSHTLNDGHYSVSFTQADRDNPHNWSVWKKTWVVLISVVLVLNSTMSTSISALGSSQITRYFHQNHEVDSTLPTSIYLAGYVFGSLIFSPLSEQYGRRIISILTFYLYSIFVVACALAPSFSALLFFRFCAGLNASSPMSVTGGVFADVFHEPRARGRIMALYMVVTISGPLLGSIIDAYVSSDSSSWRWTYWTTAIIAGCTAVGVAFQPESFAPVVLQRKAKRLRKERKDPRYIALSDTSSQTFQEIAVVVLTRPVRMIFTEPVCFFVCLYLGLIYAIFYIQFQSYSLIFKGVYGFNVEQLSLTLLPSEYIKYILQQNVSDDVQSALGRSHQAPSTWSGTTSLQAPPGQVIQLPGSKNIDDCHWLASEGPSSQLQSSG